jgi:ABC-type oligopeptide transport system substrate-binding subunit
MKGFYKFILVFLVAFTLIGCEGLDIPSDILTVDLTTDELTLDPTTSTLTEDTSVYPTTDITQITNEITTTLITDITTELPTTNDLTTEEPTTATPLEMKLRSIYQMAVDSESFDGTYEEWLETVRGPQGLPGEDGREIIIQISGSVLQWQYTGDTEWIDLFDLSLLTGLSILDIEINDFGELVVTYSDLSEVNLGPIITFYTVIFRDYNHYIIDIQLVEHGSSAIRPVEPFREGYTFTDWDQDFTNVQDNLVVYALYDVNVYEVSFVTDTEDTIDPMNVNHGDTLVLPIPEKLGYEFMGWFLGDSVSDRQFYNDSVVEDTLALYARWQPILYEITFLGFDDQVLLLMSVTIEDVIRMPHAPYVEGHIFTGWDNDLSTLEEGLVVRAIYEPTYTLSIIVDGDVVDYFDDYLEGDAIDLSFYEDPDMYGFDGVAFMGWFLDPEWTVVLDNFVMPSQDLQVFGAFSHYPEIYFIHYMDEIMIDASFDPLSLVEAYDMEDGDITEFILYEGTIDTSVEGEYTITYKVTDLSGLTTEVEKTFRVVDAVGTYPTGTYNYQYAPVEVRNAFMAAAEEWLLNTQTGGIPIYSQAYAFLLNTRVSPGVEDFIPVIGYGLEFGEMNEDDSTELMVDGLTGNAGEFTFRDSIRINPSTFNHMDGVDYDTEKIMSHYLDALYTYEINANANGFVLNPSMASNEPMAVDPWNDGYGQELAYVWEISLKDNLVWTYHPDTDISSLGQDHQVLDANDFVETFNRAINEGWNLGEYLMMEGVDSLQLIDDLTFQINFVKPLNQWQVKHLFSSSRFSPVHLELYDLLGGTYGTSPATTAYHGPYYLDEYIIDEYLTLKANANFHDQSKYHYTGYAYIINDDMEQVFQMFMAGKLDYAALPNSQKEAYKDDARRFLEPIGSTYRININGLGTVENQQWVFPDSTWVPEPLLANQDFKTAMYFAVDRDYVADDIFYNGLPQMYMFSDNHFLDPYTGIPYRRTVEGMGIGLDLSPETYGYNLEVAKAYWDLAIEQLVNDGVYQPGTSENWTIIDLDFYVMNTNAEQLAFGQYIKETFETTFVSNEHHIKVSIHVEPKDFPNIYYDHIMKGEFDLSIGSLSSDSFNLAEFLYVFSSDNRSGLTFNWGIETSLPNILVEYQNEAGETLREYWSFNAIYRVLTGEVDIVNGMEYIEYVEPVTEYFITGQFANWNDAIGNPDYLMLPTTHEDDRLMSISDRLITAEEVYAIDVYLPEGDPGWGETYMVNDQLTYFSGNFTFKFLSTTFEDNQTYVNWWGPSPLSGEIYNLTPETYYMPQYISEFDENYDPSLYLGHSNTNPAAFEPGYYTMVVAIMDGDYWLGAVKQETPIPVNLVDNADFSQGTLEWNFDAGIIDGGVGSYEVIDEVMVVHVDLPTRSAFGPRIYSNQIIFEQGKTYRISFDAKADADRFIQAVIGNTTDHPMIFNHFSPEEFIFALTTDWQNFNFEFKMNQYTDTGMLGFAHGTFMGMYTSGTVYYDNIEIIEVEPSPDYIPPIFYGLRDYTINLNDDFDPLANIFVYDNHDGFIDHNQIHVTSDLDTGVAGMYLITYQVWDQAGNHAIQSIIVEVVEFIYVETDEIVDGGFETTTTIVPEIQDPDQGNADITPEDIWYYYLADWNGANAIFSVVDQAATIDITASGSFNWSIILKQKGISLEEGQTYKLTFNASATAIRHIDVMVTEDHSMTIVLDETTQTYELVFTYLGPTTSSERIQFLMGMNEVINNATITIDDVVLSELDVLPPSEPLWHSNGNIMLNPTEAGLEITYANIIDQWWLDNTYTILTDMDETVTGVTFTFTGVEGHEYVFKVEGNGLSNETHILATGQSQQVTVDLSYFTIHDRMNLQLLVIFTKTVGASGTLLIEDWQYNHAIQVSTIQEALDLGQNTYVQILGVTVIEANDVFVLFTDGTDIFEFFQYDSEIVVGQVYDITGLLYYYFLTPQLISNEFYALDYQISDAAVSQEITYDIGGVNEIVAATPIPTEEAPIEFIKYTLTAAVYVNSEWGDFSVFLVPTDYDFSAPLEEGAITPNGSSIEINYLSDQEILSGLHGQIITLEIIMQGYRFTHQNLFANFFGTIDDITIHTVE